MAYHQSVCSVDYFFSYLYRFSCLRERERDIIGEKKKSLNNSHIYISIYWLMFTVVLKEDSHKEKLSNYFCFSSSYISIYQYYTYSCEGLNKIEKKLRYEVNICIENQA
jgi:hypothetical protein